MRLLEMFLHFLETFWDMFGQIITVLLAVAGAMLLLVLFFAFPIFMVAMTFATGVGFAIYRSYVTWHEKVEAEERWMNRILWWDLQSGDLYR